MSDNLTEPFAVCECQCGGVMTCECGTEERAIRAYAGGAPMPPMTVIQREWCLREIDSVEGYDRRDHGKAPDDVLASTVLRAWVDYCRDKGLL